MMNMDALKLSGYLRAREIYMEAAVKAGLLSIQADLLDSVDEGASQEGAEAAGETPDQTATNVHRLQRGISQLPEDQQAADQAPRGPKASGVTIQ